LPETEAECMGKFPHEYVGVALVASGAALIILAAIVAYVSFYNYQLPWSQHQPSSIETTIASLVTILVEITARLGFLGIMVWAGGILLKYGIQSLAPKSAPR